MRRERPSGVTPIGVLDIAGDSSFIIGGIVLFIGIPTLANSSQEYGIEPNSFAWQLLKSSLGYVIASGLTTLGIVNAGASIGLLMGKHWAWNLTMVLAFISAAVDIIIVVLDANVSSLISAIIGCIIDGIILYYLCRPNVKSYFGRTNRARDT
ncbi:MAG: hypothetical protein E6K98_06975 [Thaumarchaeota archaeon]|nr:MAG: hypothetical protein E6K98_06975 [Nitrososphaerota archaeon]TLX94578.1 MAG: hypothetical protein E6K91_05820 [Nitrososphaerota archaeon]